MRPIFTVHAGEYLTGSFIEKTFPGSRVWIPSKDTGIDLLVTDANCKNPISLQVKFSKDFLPTHMQDFYKNKLKVCTWFQFSQKSINFSKADYWILVLQSYMFSEAHYLLITPKELLQRIKKYHGKKNIYNLYFWVTSNLRCYETRGLKTSEKKRTVDDTLNLPFRCFSKYLDNWTPLKQK